MWTAEFDFELPVELIAQGPADRREASRMLVLRRDGGAVEHRGFVDFPEYLRSGDVLVLNDSRVIPARLRALNLRTGGKFELLLLEECGANDWWCMVRPAKRARLGTRLHLCDPLGVATTKVATVIGANAEGHRRIQFEGELNIVGALDSIGEVPLPPYINRESGPTAEDRDRYQTVFADRPGSVAAPTAGLHFTAKCLDEIRGRGVRVCFVTLHVGLATFAPVKSETVEGHTMHEEKYDVTEETAAAIESARAAGGRVVAVGTTTVRVLESIAEREAGRVVAGNGRTRIFIYPPRQFRVIDVLLTNFHLPLSTLLMLVSAFAGPGETSGREKVLSAYREAVRERYRFFSYGDAMLVL